MDVNADIGKSLCPTDIPALENPLVLQVLALKRYHDEDTRQNSYSLILSDGNAASNDENKLVRLNSNTINFDRTYQTQTKAY
jgi:hypothetical protein